jgi:hypothetical protein
MSRENIILTVQEKTVNEELANMFSLGKKKKKSKDKDKEQKNNGIELQQDIPS